MERETWEADGRTHRVCGETCRAKKETCRAETEAHSTDNFMAINDTREAERVTGEKERLDKLTFAGRKIGGDAARTRRKTKERGEGEGGERCR